MDTTLLENTFLNFLTGIIFFLIVAFVLTSPDFNDGHEFK